MSNQINFKENYIQWLKENVYQHQISGDIYRFTLPFLDRHNDQIEVYIKKNFNDFVISDDRYTVSDLELSGFDIFSSSRRKAIYNQILYTHGISETSDHELFVSGNASELPMKKHMLAQCIQKIGDLFYLSQPNVKSLFLEDVQMFLDNNQIRYISNLLFIGKSKLPTSYDFAIPKSKNSPQRIIKVVNNLTIDYARSILFTWNDIAEVRKDDSILYTFILDTEKKISMDAITALREYDVEAVPWSARSNYSDVLSA